MDTLNSMDPVKKKYAPGNQTPFMTKDLSKEIMTRLKSEEHRLLYTQKRNKRFSFEKN